MRPFIVLSNYFTPRQHGKTENHQFLHLKSLNMCALLQSPLSSYEDYMAIYVLSTICQPYDFAGFQIDFEGY